MPNNTSFPYNQPTDHGEMTAKKHEELLLCPPFPDARFETLDSSLPYFINTALIVPLAVATTVSNLVVLLAMRHVASIRLPSKLLLCSLVITDLAAGSVVAPQWAAFLFLRAINPDIVQCPLHRSYVATGSALGTASLLGLTAISLDRYAALFFYLKYKQIVTTRPVGAVLAFKWTLGLLLAVSSLWDSKLWRAVFLSIIVVAFPAIFVSCIKIYRRFRAQQIQPQAPDQAQQQTGNTLNMERYRGTASAMLGVCVFFLICYLPFWCFAAISLVIERTALSEYLLDFCYSLVQLNSLLNPFVYCLRLHEIRTEAVKQLHKLFCRSSPTQWTDSIDWIWAYRCPGTRHAGRLYLINLVSQKPKLSNLFPVCGWTVNLAWHRKRIFNVSMQVIPCVRTVTQSLEYSVYRHTVLRELQDSLYPVPI